jgi:hypothetical protein
MVRQDQGYGLLGQIGKMLFSIQSGFLETD